MKALLTSELCGWPADYVETLQDLEAPHELATELVELTEGVEDVLLLYYVGHGLRIPNGQLALTLRGTRSNRALLRHTAMLYADVADILRGCPAATKLVILDCCYAELGNKNSDQFQSSVLDDEPVDGLYCIWASKEWEKAKSPTAGGLTYFTNEFIRVIRQGIPGKPSQLTIDQIFIELRARLVRSGRPEPAQSGVRNAQNWPFSYNAAPAKTHYDPDWEITWLIEQRAAAEARERALRVEIERLKDQKSRAKTTREMHDLQSIIDSAERQLDEPDIAESASEPALLPDPIERDSVEPRLLNGRYVLESLVRQSSMAEVYRARDLVLGRTVAITILRADRADSQGYQTRFRHDALSTASLNHPSIVALYDTCEDLSAGVSVFYNVMEYVDGYTVLELLDKGDQLPWERILEIISGVLRALEYSHQMGIVHRNIKPSNVVITGKGQIKVMNFGISYLIRDAPAAMPQTAQVIGTIEYLSPEQARGEQVDARSDLYSTGCMMYRLLTGRLPFTGDSPVAIAYQHVRVNPDRPSSLNRALPSWADSIVLKAMAKSPNDRYQSAAEMQADIQRAASGEWPQ